MTAFSTNQIPTTGVNAITTLEQLVLWALEGLNTINLTVTAIEGDGTAQRVTQVGEFFVTNNNTYRLIGRISLAIDPTHAYNGKKRWANALELSQTVLDPSFTS